MAPAHFLLVEAFIGLVGVAARSSAATAFPDNPCTAGWQVNGTYDSLECTVGSSVEWIISTHWATLIPGSIGLLIALFCPFFFIGRYACGICGSSKPRPGHFCCGGEYWDGKLQEEVLEAYSVPEVKVTRFSTIALLVFPVCFISLAYYGGATMIRDIDNILDNGRGLFDWIRADATSIAEVLDPDGDVGNTFAAYTSTRDRVLRQLNDFQRDSVDAPEMAQLKGYIGGIAFPTIAPAACFVLAAFCAVFHVRACIPMFTACLVFTFCLFAGLATTAVLIINVGVDVTCQELDAQVTRSPGIFQHYLVPKCDDVNPFRDILTTLDDMELRFADEACSGFDEACDGSSVATPTRPFHCTPNPNCRELDDVETVANSTRLKHGAPNPCGSEHPECTWQECAQFCEGSIKEAADSGLTNLRYVQRVLEAIRSSDVLQTMSNCNTFFDYVLVTLDVCSGLPTSISMVFTAGIMILLGNVLLIVALVRGSKQFFDYSRYGKGRAQNLGKKYTSLNAGEQVTRPYAPVAAATPTKDGGGGGSLTAAQFGVATMMMSDGGVGDVPPLVGHKANTNNNNDDDDDDDEELVLIAPKERSKGEAAANTERNPLAEPML